MVRRVTMVVVLLAVIAGVAVLAVGALSGGSATNTATHTGQHAVAQTPARSGVVEVVQTSADLSQRLTHLPDLRFEPQLPTGIPVIDVDDGVRYQRIEGVGAAMTDTSAWLIHDELPPAASAGLMRNLFGPDGVRLRVIRIPIGASDFTRNGTPYSYDDLPAGQSDPGLRHFSVAHDDAYVVPELRAALRLDSGIQMLASPWSPPGWMKGNGALDNFANTGTLLPQYDSTLARYLVAFIRAYEARGVPIDALTPQNEPQQPSRYPGLNLPVRAQATFIARYLVPALAAADLHVPVFGLDYAWRYARRADALSTAPGLSGIAWHCYEGNPTVMSALHRSRPGLAQLITECSSGISPGPPSELMIASIRNWASAVVLWNLALDPAGGPVQPPNMGCRGCTALVTIDPAIHTVRYGSDYYQLGQLGAFVAPGARRIASNTFVTYNYVHLRGPLDYSTPGLDDVAFENPDGTDVLLVYNGSQHTIRFAVRWRGQAFVHALPAGATVTFVWR